MYLVHNHRSRPHLSMGNEHMTASGNTARGSRYSAVELVGKQVASEGVDAGIVGMGKGE
jgi:hypothetical protein